MPNILEYIKWRGDLTLKQTEFNEIDNLILARLSYFDLDDIITGKEEITIKEAYEKFKKKNVNKVKVLQKEDLQLFPELAKSKRFSEMKITEYINKINKEQEKQFSAVTIIMPDNTIYVAFRGTDNTIIGWKEDLNMSFKKNVPAQIDGVKYLTKIAKKYSNKLRIGGHSKGGNIAIYASAFSDNEIRKRIIKIYNNDGPGVDDEVTKSEAYINILEKIKTYVPQTSIIGRLLSHEEKYTVVKSTQVGIMQHDLYTWQLLGKEFIHLDEVDNGSIFIDKTIKTWLKEVDPKQRGETINIIFDILEQTDATTISEVKTNWLKNIGIILKTYKNIDPKEKEIAIKTMEALFVIAKNNFFEKIPKSKLIHKKIIK